MAKNYSVDVGDHEAITEAIGKQKVSKIIVQNFNACFSSKNIFLVNSFADRCPRIGIEEAAIGRIDLNS